MKEFIEKLIGRFRDCTTIEDYGELFVSLDEVENIINELAEESNNDFCEWKYIDSTSYNATIPCRGNTMNIKSMRYYTYCPYCGKKIKVVW